MSRIDDELKKRMQSAAYRQENNDAKKAAQNRAAIPGLSRQLLDVLHRQGYPVEVGLLAYRVYVLCDKSGHEKIVWGLLSGSDGWPTSYYFTTDGKVIYFGDYEKSFVCWQDHLDSTKSSHEQSGESTARVAMHDEVNSRRIVEMLERFIEKLQE